MAIVGTRRTGNTRRDLLLLLRPVPVGTYLQFDVNAHVLTRTRVIEQMEHGGDQRFVDAAQLTINHALQDGAEPSTLGHHLRVLQSCTHKRSAHTSHGRQTHVHPIFEHSRTNVSVKTALSLQSLRRYFWHFPRFLTLLQISQCGEPTSQHWSACGAAFVRCSDTHRARTRWRWRPEPFGLSPGVHQCPQQ